MDSSNNTKGISLFTISLEYRKTSIGNDNIELGSFIIINPKNIKIKEILINAYITKNIFLRLNTNLFLPITYNVSFLNILIDVSLKLWVLVRSDKIQYPSYLKRGFRLIIIIKIIKEDTISTGV